MHVHVYTNTYMYMYHFQSHFFGSAFSRSIQQVVLTKYNRQSCYNNRSTDRTWSVCVFVSTCLPVFHQVCLNMPYIEYSQKKSVYLPTPNARSIAALALPLLCVRRKPQRRSVLKVAGCQLQWYGYFMREYQGQAFADASDLLQTRRSVCMRRTPKNWNG